MPSLEDYTLLTLRTELKAEFGCGAEMDSRIDFCINQAIKEIIRKRQSWPWLNKEFVQNVAALNTGTCNVTNGSPTVAAMTGSPAVRHIFNAGTTASDLNSGYLLQAFSAGTGTLDANYLGTTVVGANYVSAVGYYPLPTDFMQFRTLYDVLNPDSKLTFIAPYKLEELRRRQTAAIAVPSFYTVTHDPLPNTAAGHDPNRQYLLVYPYLPSVTTLRGLYRHSPRNLTADGDIPVVPRDYRIVLYQQAAWNVALKIREGATLISYERKAHMALDEMMKEFQFADEVDLPDWPEDHRFIRFPANFPDVG